MDFVRFKRACASISVAALTLTNAGVAAAYSDVASGVWYEDAVNAFVDAGYLDGTQPRFRGGENANRAEFVKLVVELNGGILSTPPAVPSFDDAPTGAWYYGYFEEAGKEGWVRGDGDCYGSHPCYARPGDNINRAEAAALIVRSFGLEWTGDAPQFVDNPSGQWYTDVIQTAADHCVLQGDDASGRVRPSDNMNRAEMVVMLYRVDQGLSYGVDCGTSEESGEAMVTDVVATSATTLEVEFNTPLDQGSAEDVDHYSVTGSPELPIDSASLVNPTTVELTLGESMDAGHEYTVTVADVLAADGRTFSDAMTFLGYSALVTGDGVLEVSVSSSSPVGDTVPQGAIGVVMLSTDLTASCDDSVTIEHVTLLHEGFGDESDIDGVYAAINGARVTRKRTIDSEDQTADLRFSSPLVLDPCETVTVDFVADFSSSATTAAEHNLVVELPSDVVGNARDVAGNFPLRGSSFRMAAVTSGQVSVTYRTVAPDEVEVGDVGVVIGKFEVSVDSVEDQTFYSMTFEQNSSASDGDFENIAVRRTDGTILTNTVSQSVGDFVTLVFDPPFTVLEGDKITLEIISDVVGGAGDSMIMHFEETSDLFAVGSLYGYGVNGQLYGSQIFLPTETSDLPDTVSIDAGEFTVGIDGPATQDYTRDDNDAVLADIEFKTGGEPIDVKDFFILVQAQSSSGGILCPNGGASGAACGSTGTDDTIQEILEDVEIRNKSTGRTIDGVRLTGTDDSGQSTATSIGNFQVYRFDDFIVRGDEVWEFRVDFIDNGAGKHPANGDQFRIHICGEPKEISNSTNTVGCNFGGVLSSSATAYQMDIEGLSTGDRVQDVRPRGTITGNFHRIANATLSIAVKTLNATETTVENAKNINLLRFEARAGEAEDILFTKAIFDADSGSLLNVSNYALWVDTDGDGQVDTLLEDGVASQNDRIPFQDLLGGGYVIPREETVIFEVHGDVSSSLTNNDLEVKFATGTSVQASYIEAEELDDGSNLSGITTNSTCQTDTDTTAESNCDITVTTADSTLWSLVSQGALFVTKDSTPLRARQLLAGSLGEAVLRLQFRAQNEDIDVTDLQITSSGSNASAVERLELYKEGESTPFALATIGGCGTDDALTYNPHNSTTGTAAPADTFCANMEQRQLVVDEGEDLDVIVRPRMKADTSGGVSNQLLGFFIENQEVSIESSGSGAVRARGDESSNNLSANDKDGVEGGEVYIGITSANDTCTGGVANQNCVIASSHNRSVLAKVTSITNASPHPNGSPVPTGVTPVGEFKFTAAAHSNSDEGLNDVVLSGVVFDVNATNVNIDAGAFKFYNQRDSTVTKSCQAHYSNSTRSSIGTAGTSGGNASGSLLVDCRGLVADSVNTEVDEGSDETFVLEADILDSQISAVGSTLQASITNFESVTRNNYGVASGESHIHWRDSDGGAAVSFFWIEYPETVVKSVSYSST